MRLSSGRDKRLDTFLNELNLGLDIDSVFCGPLKRLGTCLSDLNVGLDSDRVIFQMYAGETSH